MTSFFDKLNLLLRSSVNNLLDDIAPTREESPRSKKRTVESLRERINQAVAYEEDLQKQINAQEDEILSLNEQADRAVEQGRDALARHLIAKVQRRQQHLEMLRVDLDTHQRIAQDLILEVNRLDAALASMQAPQATPAKSGKADFVEAEEQATESDNRYQKMMEDAQARMTILGEKLQVRRQRVDQSLTDDTDLQADSPAVEDELEVRRNRLMKK